MKGKLWRTCFSVWFIVLIVSSLSQPVFRGLALQEGPGGDSPDVVIAQSTGFAPQPDDEHFVADTGGELDLYLYRNDGDGIIRFSIPITRYYFNQLDTKIKFQNGFLTSDAITHVKNKHILPDTAELNLRVYDVDEDDTVCPEVDFVSVNGKAITQFGSKVKLSGANNTWSTPTFTIPIGILKFPQARGTNGNAPQPANNEISIQVDASKCGQSEGRTRYWAVQVDYGVIKIEGPTRPVLFAHGWTGTTSSFKTFETSLSQHSLLKDGIPSAGQVNLQEGIYPITQTAGWLKTAINNAATEFGVDKINIFAHSKGGLVSRKALRDDVVAEKVEHLITFASPHHGTDMANLLFVTNKCFYFEDYVGQDYVRCVDAGLEFQTDRIRDEFNYSGCTRDWPWSAWENCTPRYKKQPDVTYISFAANGDEAVKPLRSTTFPWDADAVPFPNSINVAQRFDTSSWFGDHSEILEEEDVFECAVSYIDSEDWLSASCSSIFDPGALDMTITDTSVEEEAFQVIMNKDGTLGTGETLSLSTEVDGGTIARFEVYTDVPITYTLTNPNDDVIDPSVAATDPDITYSAIQDGNMWVYQYEIANPITGTWQNDLVSINAANYVVTNRTNSTVQLGYLADQASYQPGDLITLQTALAENAAPIAGVTFSGMVTHPDQSTLALTFYDDGSHGDSTSGDGIYTSQFNASAAGHGHEIVTIQATKNNIHRIVDALIPFGLKTAEFQSIIDETAVDTNANGLYDRLDLDLSVNILHGGHFEFSGTLVDGQSQPVSTAYYSTWNSDTGELLPGLRTVTLSFDGEEIQKSNTNGPYTLTNVIISDVSSSALEVDEAYSVYNTASYQFAQFERPLVILGGVTEEPIDTNSNSLFDYLVLTLNLDVVKSGSYDVNGRLIDGNGKEIGWTSGSFYAGSAGVYALELWFSGDAIGTNSADGPYFLSDLSITNTSWAFGVNLSQTYTTQAYPVLNFEGASLVPQLLSPTMSETLLYNRPTLDWADFPNATGYILQISRSHAFTSTSLILNTTIRTPVSSYKMPKNLPANKVLYWRVRAKQSTGLSPWSAVRTFTTANPPSIPIPVSPANNALTADYTPRFDWKNSTLPSPAGSTTFDHYQIQVDDTRDFSSVIVDETTDFENVNDSEFTPDTDLPSNSRFYWRVRSFNTLGQYSVWSPVFSFRTRVLPPVLTLPVNTSTVMELQPLFAWDPPSGSGTVSGYTIQISKNNTFKDVIHTGNPTGSSYVPNVNLPKNMTLFWRVLTKGTNGPSVYSSPRSFTTPVNPPAIPSLLLPATNQLVKDNTPTFTWKSVSTAQSYIIQVDNNSNFSSPEINDGSPITPTFTPATDLSSNIKYYWRVRAVNSTGELSNWSAVRYFRTAILPPGLLTPIDDSTAVLRKPLLDWENVPGNTGYILQVWKAGTTPILVKTVTLTKNVSQYQFITNLLPNTAYYWKVQTVAVNGPSLWSDPFDFVTGP